MPTQLVDGLSTDIRQVLRDFTCLRSLLHFDTLEGSLFVRCIYRFALLNYPQHLQSVYMGAMNHSLTASNDYLFYSIVAKWIHVDL